MATTDNKEHKENQNPSKPLVSGIFVKEKTIEGEKVRTIKAPFEDLADQRQKGILKGKTGLDAKRLALAMCNLHRDLKGQYYRHVHALEQEVKEIKEIQKELVSVSRNKIGEKDEIIKHQLDRIHTLDEEYNESVKQFQQELKALKSELDWLKGRNLFSRIVNRQFISNQ